MIPAADVRAAIARNGHTSWDAGVDFRVSERTVRRWMHTGLPLLYGAVNVTPMQWDLYVSTRSSGRTGVDRQLSDVVKKPSPLPMVKPRPRSNGEQRQARARLDRGAAAAEPTVRAKARATRPPRREPRPPPSKRKKLRTSRALLAAYRKLHSR